jgi:hypothetical protein
MCFEVAYTTTAAGTPTGMNDKNISTMSCLMDEIDIIRGSLDDILSQNTKLV